MKDHPLVSVIIPNYNNEKYIPECLDSVINQTYRNLEIIVVNDGSTDGSMNIINDYMSRDGRIKCIDQQNTGLAIARKNGLDEATGEWIQHLDSDDFLELDGIERLIKRAEESKADIIGSPFFLYYDTTDKELYKVPTYTDTEGLDYLHKIINEEGCSWNIWSNFHKRSLFFDYNINIIQGADFGEDVIFITQLLLNNPKVATVTFPVVNYRQHIDAMTKNPIHSLKKINGQKFLISWMDSYLDKHGLRSEFDYIIARLRLDLFNMELRSGITTFSHENMQCIYDYYKIYPTLHTLYGKSMKKYVMAFHRNALLGKLRYLYCKLRYHKIL